MKYNDRALAVTPHAVARFRERASAGFLDNEWIRRIIARAVARGVAEPHYVPGQARVRLTVAGSSDVYAIVGRDETGWSDSGVAVVTVLTAEQVEAREVHA